MRQGRLDPTVPDITDNTGLVFDLMAARPADRIPSGPGWAMEPKYDGYRVMLARSGDAVQLNSRRGTDLTEVFPEVAASESSQIPDKTVLDGELVIYVDGRLSFDALQQRMAAGRGCREPIDPRNTLVPFDALVADSQDKRNLPWRQRCDALEAMAASWEPPMQLTPYSDDPLKQPTGWKRWPRWESKASPPNEPPRDTGRAAAGQK